MNNEARGRSNWPLVAAIGALLLAMYAGTYFATVRRAAVPYATQGRVPGYRFRIGSVSSFHGPESGAAMFFVPIHAIDRRVRLEFWNHSRTP